MIEINAVDWNEVVKNLNIYASLPYLLAMEKSFSGELNSRYIQFYNSDSIPVAVAIIQLVRFIDKGYEDKDEFCKLRNLIKGKLLTAEGVEMLTCGTPYASGENGFIFSELISREIAYNNLALALIELQEKEKLNFSAPIILYKEFLPSSFVYSNRLIAKGFHEFYIDVNMILKISPTWKNINDYLESMVTKFRTKAKTAYRKSESLVIENFDEHKIEKYKTKIFALYLSVLEKSSFQFGILNEDSFLNLKKNLEDNFIVRGYFLNGKLVGFSSAFLFNSILDANYVGINYEFNQEFAIYQRMLYDFIELAINRNCKELRFGRTAEEIKSSVGASPISMKLFMKHRNPIANKILKAILKTVKPSTFELRNPFKQEYYQAET